MIAHIQRENRSAAHPAVMEKLLHIGIGVIFFLGLRFAVGRLRGLSFPVGAGGGSSCNSISLTLRSSQRMIR
jgi:hypothetical protein